jgi:agmatine deiminase
MTNLEGRPLEIVELPMPPQVVWNGERLPATYANFYIANEVVLLPGYRADTDEHAAAVLKGLFPGREVVCIDCTDLVWGLGAFHCLTQQVPTAKGRVFSRSEKR